MRKQYFIIFWASLFMCLNAYAQYHQVLPKDVRTFLIRNIKAEVSSSYNKSKSENPFAVDIDTNITNLKNIEVPLIQEALELIEPYPDAYEKISFGSHFFNADASLNVDAYGFGYGVTNKTTTYVGIPIFEAEVRMAYKRTKGSSTQEVAEILQGRADSDYAQTLGNIIEQIHDIDGGVIQSAIVNEYNYNEIGSWSGSGPGDVEVGVMHKLKDEKNYGLKVSGGLILPTGRVDDPDTLQDIGFGDGQLDAFAEVGGAYRIYQNNYWNYWTRYTYQFESKKELRVIESNSFPLSDRNGTFREKLGNKLSIGTSIDYAANDWLYFQPSLIANYTGKSKYYSKYKKANEVMANNTESNSLSFRLSSSLSTVNLYKSKRFVLPAKISFSYQNTFSGQNTPKVERTELEFTMFF